MAELPRSALRRTLTVFRPAIAPSLLAGLALTLIALEVGATSLLGLVFQLVDPKGISIALSLHDLGYSLVVAPLASAMLLFGASLPSGLGSRALSLGLLTLVLAFGLASCATLPLTATESDGSGELAIAGLILYGPLTLAAGALAVGTLATVPLRVRQRGVEQAEDWLAAQLEHTGWLDVPAAASLLGQEEDWVWEMAVALAVDRQMPVRDQDTHLVHRDTAAAGLQKVLDHVRTEGHTSLDGIAAATGLPQPLVSSWLDELAAEPSVPLTVDRQTGKALWDVAAGQLDMSWCHRCGGPERRSGGGVLRCGSCGSERAT